MKKFGFTLSEVIIALAVVGVISAIAAPMLGSLMPDKNKAIVLKTHKTITDITKDLLDDPRMYRDYTYNGYTYIGLAAQGPNNNDNEYTKIYPYLVSTYGNLARGVYKYPYLLSEHLEIQERHVTNKGKFKTIDGIYWFIKVGQPQNGPNKTYTTKHEIAINVRGVDPITGPAKGIFSYNTIAYNQTPDTFVFKVDTYGKVTAGDALTAAYLENPDKLNDKKKDYDRAKELLSKY